MARLHLKPRLIRPSTLSEDEYLEELREAARLDALAEIATCGADEEQRKEASRLLYDEFNGNHGDG